MQNLFLYAPPCIFVSTGRSRSKEILSIKNSDQSSWPWGIWEMSINYPLPLGTVGGAIPSGATPFLHTDSVGLRWVTGPQPLSWALSISLMWTLSWEPQSKVREGAHCLTSRDRGKFSGQSGNSSRTSGSVWRRRENSHWGYYCNCVCTLESHSSPSFDIILLPWQWFIQIALFSYCKHLKYFCSERHDVWILKIKKKKPKKWKTVIIRYSNVWLTIGL